MVACTERRANYLLAALPEDAWQRWLPHVESVEMPLGQVLQESGQCAGLAFRLPAHAIKEELARSPTVSHLLLRYMQGADYPDGADRGV